MTAPRDSGPTPPSTPDTSTIHLRWLIGEGRAEAAACHANEQAEAGDLYEALADALAAVVAERDEASRRLAAVRQALNDLDRDVVAGKWALASHPVDAGWGEMLGIEKTTARIRQALATSASAAGTTTGTPTGAEDTSA